MTVTPPKMTAEKRRRLNELAKMARLRDTEPVGPVNLDRLQRRANGQLSASDLAGLPVVALWPTWKGFIKTREGPVETARVAVWRLDDGDAVRYGQAALFQKALLALPVGEWAVGSVVKSERGYQLVPPSARLRARFMALLPEAGK
jgi:hypothetical protein